MLDRLITDRQMTFINIEERKMKARYFILPVLVLVMLLTACSMNQPVCATSNPLGAKTGTYTQTSFLMFPPSQSKEAAIAAAAKNGGITRISTVDYIVTWKIIFTDFTTVVTGE
jgi:uncharacterized lipoprotein YajG